MGKNNVWTLLEMFPQSEILIHFEVGDTKRKCELELHVFLRTKPPLPITLGFLK